MPRCRGVCASGNQCSRGATTDEGYCKSHKQSDDCAICYEAMKRSGVLRAACGHSYHVSCLSKWAEQNETCPMCRGDLDAKTLQRLYPDVVDFLSETVFTFSYAKRQRLMDMVTVCADLLRGDQAVVPSGGDVMVPVPPVDLYSYISMDDVVDVEEDDLARDPTFIPYYNPMGY
jgi:hypothetical protein